MRFNVVALLSLFLLASLFSPLVFAQVAGEPGAIKQPGPGFGSQGSGFGNELGQQAGSAFAQTATSGIEGAASGLMGSVNAVVQMVLFGVAVLVVVLFIWLILLLLVLRSIMKREDLTGGEKAAWVAIVFFFGFLPLSPFGMLLYVLSGGKKTPQAAQTTAAKNVK